MNIRNEIKAYIVREGFTMSELVAVSYTHLTLPTIA